MKLRRLELCDAPLMIEWMHDKSITNDLRADFSAKTIEDAERFIKQSWNDKKNIHFAIASDGDEYMGTVSLKEIKDQSAEFAIVVRTCAMHKGYAWIGMQLILEKAFQEYGLETVYWCVDRANSRAVRFYDKHNFHEAVDIPKRILAEYSGLSNLKWYSVLKGDTLSAPEYIAGCRVIHINTIPTVNAGELSFFEQGDKQNGSIPFEIKRVYYISKVPEGVRRGFHAHKTLKQLLFCPFGRIQIVLDNLHGREEIELSDPSIGLLIEEPTWREMLWLEKNSVLCVAASECYDPEDYIRDYDLFKAYVE